MTAAIDPKEVRAALDRMKGGDASSDVFETIVAAAELYAEMKVEWGFISPQATLYYVSRNDMLVETMHIGRPDVDLLARIAPDWEVVRAGEVS